jgi:hypothetical protein
MGVEEKSVTHVDTQVEGRGTVTLKQIPGLYLRADAELIRDGRAAREAEKKAKAAAKEAAAEPVERHPTGTEANDTLEKIKAAAAASEA